LELNKWNKEDSGIREVNMTPLIDVSLVLVVILLLASPLAFESSIDVRNSRETARKAKESHKGERIELVVLSEEQIRVNRVVVNRDQLQATLQPLIEDSAERTVTVACENGVSHGAFVYTLDQAKMSGALQIAVVGR